MFRLSYNINILISCLLQNSVHPFLKRAFDWTIFYLLLMVILIIKSCANQHYHDRALRYANDYGWDYLCSKVSALVCNYCLTGLPSRFGYCFGVSHSSLGVLVISLRISIFSIIEKAFLMLWNNYRSVRTVNHGERIGFIVTLHLAIVFIIGIIDTQVAPSSTTNNPLILEFVHFVNIICVFGFIETTFIAKYVTSSMMIDIPPYLVALSACIDR